MSDGDTFIKEMIQSFKEDSNTGLKRTNETIKELKDDTVRELTAIKAENKSDYHYLHTTMKGISNSIQNIASDSKAFREKAEQHDRNISDLYDRTNTIDKVVTRNDAFRQDLDWKLKRIWIAVIGVFVTALTGAGKFVLKIFGAHV